MQEGYVAVQVYTDSQAGMQSGWLSPKPEHIGLSVAFSDRLLNIFCAEVSAPRTTSFQRLLLPTVISPFSGIFLAHSVLLIKRLITFIFNASCASHPALPSYTVTSWPGTQ